jgi:hypothetical protein
VRPAAAASVAELLGRPGAERIDVGALGPEHHASLVHELLGLEGALATQVKERTAGNPLFAVQLVGDWVQRGVLAVCTSSGPARWSASSRTGRRRTASRSRSRPRSATT